MSLGLRAIREEALMICSIDDHFSEDLMQQIEKLDVVQKAAYINL
jgi:hypothetical protein